MIGGRDSGAAGSSFDPRWSDAILGANVQALRERLVAMVAWARSRLDHLDRELADRKLADPTPDDLMHLAQRITLVDVLTQLAGEDPTAGERKKLSSIDHRRLSDGARALQMSARVPETIAEIRVHLDVVGDGIAALQSLDDLGPEGNARALRDEKTLWKRYEVLEQRLVELKGED